MPKVEDLIEKYKDYPDQRLIEMIRYRRDYLPEAVQAAQHVLDQREIKQEDIDGIVEGLVQKEKEKRAEANKPLSRGEKILFSVIPLVGLVFLLIAVTDAQGKGQEKRISQMFLYAGIGLLVFVGLILLSSS